MQIIGVRSSAKEIRYAILEKGADGSIVFINKEDEHCLRYPTTIQTIEEKLRWVKQEFDRILRQNQSICKIMVKMNEYSVQELKPVQSGKHHTRMQLYFS